MTRIVDLCLVVIFVLVVTTALSTCSGPDEVDAARATALNLNDALADARQARKEHQ